MPIRIGFQVWKSGGGPSNLTSRIATWCGPVDRRSRGLQPKEGIMNWRTTLTLRTMGLLFLAAVLATAVPEIGLAQSNPLIGTWKLNLAKSRFSGSPPPRSITLTFAGEG